MIILNKKKILFIFSCIVISILYLNINLKAVPTSSSPISNHVIVLDAGHGLPDGGATSTDGTYESIINLSIVEKLQKLLETSSCTVILTRSDENGIYDLDSNSIREKKVSDMKKRVEIGNNTNAELFISIHLNKIENSKYSGWQTFYKENDEKSIKIANSIQENLNSTIKRKNNRLPEKISNIYLSKNLEIPFSIVECGFLSNPEECNLLKNNDYQNKIAWGIYMGIMDYFK